MKKKTNLFARTAMTLLLAVLGSVGAWAQSEVVSIGNTDKSDGSLPIDQYSKYSLTQQIYTKDEINHAAGKITSIAFYGYDYGMERTCDVYLSPTTKNAFESNTDWVKVAPEDKVFSGHITVNNGLWSIIDFDTPYEYDGKSNLLVTVDDNTNAANSSTVYWGVFIASGNQALYYSKRYSTPVNLDPTQSIEESGAYYGRKNCIQLCFETNPKPYKLEAVEVGDKSAQIQCSLRGDATAWNLRYRKVAGEGEEEQSWTQENNLTTRSFTIEDLTTSTKYEVQVQAVFSEDILSEWTDPAVFTTSCCPVEQQVEIMYALNSQYIEWYDYAVQIVDITDEDNPVEVAHLRAPSYQAYGGTVTLCCGHKYQVNWIYDADMAVYSQSYNFSLYYNTGDLIYSMARGEAPEETAELTTFVMDCTPYCAQMPQNVSVAGTTYNSATITFASETKAGEVVYSTEANFDPNTATPTSLDFTALPVSEDPWGGTPPNSSLTLTGLESLTDYYVSVRSVCLADVPGVSRWSDPVKVTTGSRYDAPTQVIAEPVNSRTEKLSWSSRGNEMSHNLYYRKQAVGNPVDPSDIQTFGGGNGTGFSWGERIQRSYGDHPFSNMLFVEGIPAGSSFSFKAGNGKTAGGPVKFLYGKKKKAKDKNARKTMESLDMSCLNDADRAARKKQYELLIWASEEQIKLAKEKLDEGTITQEQYDKEVAESTQKIDKYRENLEMLNALPTDAQKLETMKALEASLASEGLSQEERQSKLAELNELRAITTNAENSQKDGFSITKEKESANARTRGTDDDAYIFFIRHSDPNGVLLVKDLTITPPELQGEWTVIPNVSGNSYMLTGLEPGTAYEVMVEPVYDGGTTGSRSPITVFTTLGEESEPLEGVFSVSKDKKVGFAKGNLRYSKDANWNDHWSLAEHQYDILGADNLESQEVNQYGNRFPSEDHLDLFCWSAGNSNNGTIHTYPDDSYYTGDFKEWGTQTAFTDIYGFGWSTMTKDEWTYLLSERENAATLKSFATVNGVKGLVLLPDEWNAPDGVIISEEMTAEQWATIEKTGAVFLPAAGTLTVNMDSKTVATVNDVNVVGNYWSSTPSETDVNAFSMTFTESEVEPAVDIYRRIGSAVRLVKALPEPVKGDANNDGVVNAVDIVYVVAFLKDGTKLPGFNEKAANADGNDKVDENDIQAIKEIIMTP